MCTRIHGSKGCRRRPIVVARELLEHSASFMFMLFFPAIASKACTLRNTKARGTISPGTEQFCYIRSEIGWVIFSVETREARYTMIEVICTVYIYIYRGNSSQPHDTTNSQQT